MMVFAQIFIWLATTKIGRILAVIAIVATALLVAYYKVKSIGRKEVELEFEKQKKINKEKKDEVDSDVDGTPDDELDGRMWGLKKSK